MNLLGSIWETECLNTRFPLPTLQREPTKTKYTNDIDKYVKI